MKDTSGHRTGCKQCDFGKQPNADQTACEDCPAGKVTQEYGSKCTKCAKVGTYARNSKECATCAPGKQPDEAVDVCLHEHLSGTFVEKTHVLKI